MSTRASKPNSRRHGSRDPDKLNIQTKLKIGQPRDKSEKQADAVANKVMMMPEEEEKVSMMPEEEEKVSMLSEEEEKVSMMPEEEEKVSMMSEEEEKVSMMPEDEEVQMKPEIQKSDDGQSYATSSLASNIQNTKGTGQSLPNKTQKELGSKMGADFSEVTIHTDTTAVQMNQELGAKAFTHGSDIYFNEGNYNPGSNTGKHLLAHELTHTMQQAGHGLQQNSTGKINQKIQRAVNIDDVTSEMVGQEFKVDRNFTAKHGGVDHSFSKGQKVKVESWPVSSNTATVYLNKSGVGKIRFSIPKRWLEVSTKSATGVREYSVGIAAQKGAVDTAKGKVDTKQAELDAWKAKESSYKTNRAYWENGLQTLENELQRRQGVLEKKEKVMSQMQVRETMYNRFDVDIKKWVDYYNAQFKPSTLLNSNVVKSLLFEETRLGTSGQHLELPPYSWSSGSKHPIRSRYNLGQSIDSWGPHQYLMIKEMAPTIYSSYGLGVLEAGAKWKGMTNSEYAAWNSGDFMKALKEFFEKRNASNKNKMGTVGKDLHMDYEFWIRASVRWLFYKYKSLSSPSWSAAVKAYNGSGTAASNYRDRIMGRVGATSTLDVGNN